MKIDRDWVKKHYNNEETFVIPNGVTEIGYGAFYGCRLLKNITIPNNVTEIGDRIFFDCESLKSITIPNGVTKIGKWAFTCCKSLEDITIPDGVTEIGYGAFDDCISLKNITIPNSVAEIGECAFIDCISLESITVPDSVTQISDRAFFDCISLKSITIPDSVTKIGYEAFWRCESLEDITIPDGVIKIGEDAFSKCKAQIMYKKDTYPSYVFNNENTLHFLKSPTYDGFMQIKDVPIKARLALDFIDPDTTVESKKFLNYVKKHCNILIKNAAENDDWETLDIIFNNEHKLLKPKQLEECLEFARENDYHELSVLLMHYKEGTGRYKDDNRFELEL